MRIEEEYSDYSLGDIANVKYTYSDTVLGVEFTEDAKYNCVDGFDLLLVNADINYKLPYFFDRKIYSSNPESIFNENNFETNYKMYVEYINSLKKSQDGTTTLDIEIEFNDGHTKTLHIWMMDENDAINYVPTVYSSSAGALLLRFAHSQDIDEDSLTELESAIFTLASVNNDSTNKFYVDIDTTKENIVFPMDEMSSQLELVRSRIGDTIVYNNEYSVDMGVNSVAHISHGENDYGTIFYLPDGSFATEKNLNAIGNFFYRNGIRFAELDGKLYNIDILVYGYDDTYNLQQRIDILRQIFERGYYYTDFYEPLPNSNGD